MSETRATVVLDSQGTRTRTRVVRIVGEIDLANASDIDTQLRQLLLEADCMTIDLAEVDYLDSAGLALLHGLAQDARRQGQLLRLRVPEQSSARRIVMISRLDLVVPVDP